MIRTLIAALLFWALTHATPLGAAQETVEVTQPSFAFYRITTLRAARGKWKDLRDEIRALGKPGTQSEGGAIVPLRFRHSQGDHWDFMLIQPINPTVPLLESLGQDRLFRGRLMNLVDFDEDWYAVGPQWQTLSQDADGNLLAHVEMFRAAAGQLKALSDQRTRENAFLKQTGAKQNHIFGRMTGADWDVVTIGFHKNLEAFATGGTDDAVQADRAARDNGFDGVGDIAPYLRSLLVSHQDTLAVAF